MRRLPPIYCNLSAGLIMPRMPGTTGYNSPWDKYSIRTRTLPYYRDMLTVLSAGMTAEEIILNGISKATDLTSGGRHMSNHFSKMEWHIENVSSATATHDLHAAGVARAMVYYGQKGVAITSHGESAASEGYVYEAINGASNERLPVIFVFQDNGYGISVPKRTRRPIVLPTTSLASRIYVLSIAMEKTCSIP